MLTDRQTSPQLGIGVAGGVMTVEESAGGVGLQDGDCRNGLQIGEAVVQAVLWTACLGSPQLLSHRSSGVYIPYSQGGRERPRCCHLM